MIPLSKVQLAQDELEAAIQVLKSGALRQGKVTAEFEKAFGQEVGAQFAVAVSSGTAALHLLYYEELQPGDDILVPTFTFMATASMVNMVGARPIFCDVDPSTFTLDVADARRRITPKTRAIAPVQLFGNPCDVKAITNLAQEFGLKIFWDAAQAHGATYDGKDIGSLDHGVAYSFYPSKNMFVGEGGMITVNEVGLYERLKLSRSHGQSGKYFHSSLGFNYRMTDVEAAIGLKQLPKLPGWVAARQKNAAFLTAGLHDLPFVQAPEVQGRGTHSYNQYCIVLNLEKLTCTRDEFGQRLGELGVATGVHYPRGLHQQPIYQRLYGNMTLPVAEKLAKSILALPVHPFLTPEELEKTVQAVRQVGEQVAL